MFIAGAALALTSAGTGYYILKNHPDHFKRTVFDISFSAYSTIKSTSSTLYNTINTAIYGNPVPPPEEPKFQITDLKLIQSDMILDLPLSLYTESALKRGSLLHVCYIYNNVNYRIVFNFGQDLSILTTNTQWVDEGFRNGIDFIESTTSLDNDEMWGLMHQYAGPLSDFYNEARHIQNYKGFLNTDMTSKLIEDSSMHVIKITNILGETRSFPTELKKLNSLCDTNIMINNALTNSTPDHQNHKEKNEEADIQLEEEDSSNHF
jgi:hypothetical protein